MLNRIFFETKASESGFNLDSVKGELFIVDLLYDLVMQVLHQNELCSEEEFQLFLDNYDNYFYYNSEEKYYELFFVKPESSLQYVYFLNQFGIKLVYQNGCYRIYIKK